MAPKRILYINPIPPGTNPALDSIACGIQGAFHDVAMDLRVVVDDARSANLTESLPKQIRAGIDARVDAIIFYVVDPEAGRSAVQEARQRGVAVFSIARPRYAVNASLSYPGFNQGVFMMDYLTSQLPPGSGVGVIGGPQALTDSEEVAGLVYSVQRSHCQLVNDPLLREYSNLTDNRVGARAPVKLLLDRFPDIKGLAPYNDETMLGAVDYLREIGRAGELKIVSRNGTPEAVAAVREGSTTGTWDLDAPAVGRSVAELTIQHLQGTKSYDDYAAMSPAGRMITAANVATWRPWEERVSSTPLTMRS
jgi:ABC-type sugar transport system substrate-binding protein